jgi:hypothetical protein
VITWNRKDAWIAVFDILGFRALLRQTDHDFPRALLTDRLDELIKVFEAKPTEAEVEYLIFSDTILVWSPDLESRSYPWFLEKCIRFITKSISVKLPIHRCHQRRTGLFFYRPNNYPGLSL